jgi:hypothetical protein
VTDEIVGVTLEAADAVERRHGAAQDDDMELARLHLRFT